MGLLSLLGLVSCPRPDPRTDKPLKTSVKVSGKANTRPVHQTSRSTEACTKSGREIARFSQHIIDVILIRENIRHNIGHQILFQELYLNNYPYPTIAREGWAFLALAFSLFSAVVNSEIRSVLNWINSGVDVYLSQDVSLTKVVSDKISAVEMTLAEF